jgi:hypothetical protein
MNTLKAYRGGDAKHPETPVVIMDIQSKSLASLARKVTQELSMMFFMAWKGMGKHYTNYLLIFYFPWHGPVGLKGAGHDVLHGLQILINVFESFLQ